MKQGNKILISDPDREQLKATFTKYSNERKIVHFKMDNGKEGTVGKRWVELLWR